MLQNETFYTLKWHKDSVSFIDQRLLPLEEVYVTCTDYNQVAEVIKTMVVRGAPAIGVSAAFGLALGVLKSKEKTLDGLKKEFEHIANIMRGTRPTAVNLFWAIKKVEVEFNKVVSETSDFQKIKTRIVDVANRMYEEDAEINRMIGVYGSELIKDGMNILTHCNAGALATVAHGTALAVVRAAHNQGKKIHVYSDETRPFLQGARLTVWELMKDNIPCTLLCDNMSGYLMANKKIDAVIVGADRIAANGDSANKIGTYSVAVLANYHKIPMYFAAPLSTIDIKTPDGSKIPIEQRSVDEVKKVNGRFICPVDAKAVNPSFDVTPKELITGIITEKGVIYPPFESGIRTLFKGGAL